MVKLRSNACIITIMLEITVFVIIALLIIKNSVMRHVTHFDKFFTFTYYD